MFSDLFMVCFSNRFKHQFQEKSNLILYKAPYSLVFCIVTEFKPKDRKSRTCNRKRNKKREKLKKKKIRIKKRNKKVPTEISVSLKKKHHKKKFGTKVELLLKEHLGETDAVTEVQKGNKRSFCYKCPECKKIIIEKL